MKRKFLTLLAAFITAANTLNIPAYAEDDVWTTEAETTASDTMETTTEITEVTTAESNAVTQEEFENLQGQLDELRRLFEENGYSIDGINGDVEGLSGEIDGLQGSLNDLYSLISNMRTASLNNNSDNGARTSSQTMPVNQTVTAVQTTETVTADTTPNGFLVEKAEKTPDKRDFITVSTRDGHVFYLVIDYEGENKNVYFLNTVDTADLNKLLQSENSQTDVSEKPVQSETVTVTKRTEEPKATPQEPEKENNGNGNLIFYALGVVAVVGFAFVAKKKLSGKKKFDSDDEDTDNDDFTEEESEIVEDDETEEEHEED